MAFSPIAILGAGSWGTALALYLARCGQTVTLWSHEVSEINALLADRENKQFLPGFVLPQIIYPIASLKEALMGVQEIVIAIPSEGFRKTLMLLKTVIQPSMRIVCATKGIDAETDQWLHVATDEVLTAHYPIAVLSGPTFAREVAMGKPTAAVIASRDPVFLSELADRFHSHLFHIEKSDDVIGVEIGGVTKNVLAIAAGMIDGLQWGANARAVLLAKGFQEMLMIGTKLGGRLETLTGLSGLGDLILTCLDDQSRNRRFGLAVGRGEPMSEIAKHIGQAVEGKRNAKLLVTLIRKHDLTAPIIEKVWAILQGHVSVSTLTEVM